MGGVSAPAKVFDLHIKASAVMGTSLVMAIEEVESPIVVEELQALSEGLAFIEEVSVAIKSIGPSTTTCRCPLLELLPPVG